MSSGCKTAAVNHPCTVSELCLASQSVEWREMKWEIAVAAARDLEDGPAWYSTTSALKNITTLALNGMCARCIVSTSAMKGDLTLLGGSGLDQLCIPNCRMERLVQSDHISSVCSENDTTHARTASCYLLDSDRILQLS